MTNQGVSPCTFTLNTFCTEDNSTLLPPYLYNGTFDEFVLGTYGLLPLFEDVGTNNFLNGLTYNAPFSIVPTGGATPLVPGFYEYLLIATSY